MSKTKIILDRPNITSGSINERKNFDDILSNHQIMAKPFYKNAWFYGVGGIASISLIAGSYYFTGNSGLEPSNSKLNMAMASPPPILEHEVAVSSQIFETPKEVKNLVAEKEISNGSKSVVKPEIVTEKAELIETEVISEELVTNLISKEKHSFSFFDLHPRISGKVNGSISKQELLNDKGLVTNSDVEIVEFELHVVNGVGGKVFDSKGNKLTSDMQSAIEKVNVGEEIYFENIKGQAKSGDIVKLSPLRYVLLN